MFFWIYEEVRWLSQSSAAVSTRVLREGQREVFDLQKVYSIHTDDICDWRLRVKCVYMHTAAEYDCLSCPGCYIHTQFSYEEKKLLCNENDYLKFSGVTTTFYKKVHLIKCCMNCSKLVIDMRMTLTRTLWVILCCQSLMLGLSASLRLWKMVENGVLCLRAR